MSGVWNELHDAAGQGITPPPSLEERCPRCHAGFGPDNRCQACGTPAAIDEPTSSMPVVTAQTQWFATEDPIDLRDQRESTPTEVLPINTTPTDTVDVIAALARPIAPPPVAPTPVAPTPIAPTPSANTPAAARPSGGIAPTPVPPPPPELFIGAAPSTNPAASPPTQPQATHHGGRHPAVLIAAGVGVGLLLLLLGVLGSRFIAHDSPSATKSAATAVLVPPGTITASASSTQDPEGGVTYSAENTLDGRPETAWNSDGRKDGKGPGMVLSYRFAEPVNLTSITVLNGYQKKLTPAGKTPTDLFLANSRVRGLRVITDNGSYGWDLTDTRGAQALSKDFGTTTSVRFEVMSVYPGADYTDLALSEVSFSAIETP